ncbi:YCF48-related protein [Pseudoalteromonas shioyasakiensis]|uniref:WD40/YVTN/BNR-like repeat-containing protein n=1 Tax=Pseudoalteromonas shioyasakiensis TaxID=1190813 RepID=UPI00211958AB|nr:YCF48-related protein [Pseudoalteromonas shioyasakiensis]MCQ8876845.1 YCF48-related protein [Pseudoalteromonas shioyasakiensis]
MKYLLYAGFSALASLTFALSAAPQPAISAPKADKTLLTDIEYNGDKLVAVGKFGTVITSDDAKVWQQAAVPTQVLLTAVNFINPQQGWACGHDATIINTQDGGSQWQLQHVKESLDKPCLDILFTDQQHGFAVGAYGMFYVTNDGGANWRKRFLDSLLFAEDRDYLNDLKETDPQGYEAETASILPHFNRIVEAGDKLMLVGEMGLLAHSVDNGVTWHRDEEIYPGSFFAYAHNSQGDELVAGLRGNIFTRNEQTDWQHLSNDKTATVNSILETNNNGWLLLANSGVIFHYENGTLTQEQLPDGKAILDAVVFKKQLVMASENGIKVKGMTP